MASITTRVTPWQTSQSRSPSSDRVVVVQVRTSCRRAPGLVSCGTRTQAVSVALPMSSAATRATRATGSSVISSMTMLLPRRADPWAAARGSRRGVQRRNRVLTATMQDPCRGLPAARLLCGLKRHQASPASAGNHPDFHPCRAPQPRHRRLLCPVKDLWGIDFSRWRAGMGWSLSRSLGNGRDEAVLLELRTRQGRAAPGWRASSY